MRALNLRDEPPPDAAGPPAGAPSAALVERGAYLARVGNCAACHTARGGAPMAGGKGIETPFGTVYASNLTPDAATGIGGWSSTDFWRALHNGRSKDGRLLYPAFPYPSYTRVTRDDADALYAWLRSLPAVAPAQPAARAALSLRQPGGAGGVAGAVLQARGAARRPGAHGRVEPRRLPGARPRPLRRLPRRRATLLGATSESWS